MKMYILMESFMLQNSTFLHRNVKAISSSREKIEKKLSERKNEILSLSNEGDFTYVEKQSFTLKSSNRVTGETLTHILMIEEHEAL